MIKTEKSRGDGRGNNNQRLVRRRPTIFFKILNRFNRQTIIKKSIADLAYLLPCKHFILALSEVCWETVVTAHLLVLFVYYDKYGVIISYVGHYKGSARTNYDK